MRVLLADDHDLVRDALKAYIGGLAAETQVFEAGTFPDAMRIAADQPGLDIIILDLCMPGMNGFAGLEAMRERFPGTPVVIMSGMVRREEVLTGLRHGGAGFIPKTIGGRAMLAALQLVLAGERYIPSMVLTEEDGAVPPVTNARKPGAGGGPLGVLTPRECDVLLLLSKGFSNKDIADQLALKPITVASHLKAVFRKLGATNRTQAANIANQYGFSA